MRHFLGFTSPAIFDIPVLLHAWHDAIDNKNVCTISVASARDTLGTAVAAKR